MELLQEDLKMQNEIAGNWEQMYSLPFGSKEQQYMQLISPYEGCFYNRGNASLFSAFKSLGTTKNSKVRKFILDFFIENSVVPSFFRRLTLKNSDVFKEVGKGGLESPGDSQYMAFEGLVEVVKNLKPEITKEFDKNFSVFILVLKNADYWRILGP